MNALASVKVPLSFATNYICSSPLLSSRDLDEVEGGDILLQAVCLRLLPFADTRGEGIGGKYGSKTHSLIDHHPAQDAKHIEIYIQLEMRPPNAADNLLRLTKVGQVNTEKSIFIYLARKAAAQHRRQKGTRRRLE